MGTKNEELFELSYQGEMYKIPEWLVNRFGKMNLDLDEKYLDNIMRYRPTYHELITKDAIVRQLFDESWNIVLYSQEHGLGKIVVYSPEPQFYDTLVDAMLDDHQKCFFSFSKYHNMGVMPNQNAQVRFGVHSQTRYSNRIIRWLNLYVRDIYRDVNSKDVFAGYSVYSQKGGTMSFDMFRKQRILSAAFSFAAYLYRQNESMKQLLHNAQENRQAYNDKLQKLLSRYSKEGETVFEKVSDLNDYIGFSGIYVLCFDKLAKCYIGQASKSIRHRVIAHFSKPETQFDYLCDFRDVSGIYVLHVSDEFLDDVEQDCIAFMGGEHLLNACAGGKSIVSVRGDDYNPDDYLLPPAIIRIIVNESTNVKKHNKWLSDFDAIMHDGEIAVAKLKRGVSKDISLELCHRAVLYQGESLQYVPDELKTKDLCFDAITHADDCEITFKQIPYELLTEDFLVELLTYSRKLFKLIPSELITDTVIAAKSRKKK